MWVLERLLRGIVVGSVKLSKSYGKSYLTVSHSFSFFFFNKIVLLVDLERKI